MSVFVTLGYKDSLVMKEEYTVTQCLSLSEFGLLFDPSCSGTALCTNRFCSIGFKPHVNRKMQLSWKSHLDKSDICRLKIYTYKCTYCSYTYLHTVNNFTSLLARC